MAIMLQFESRFEEIAGLMKTELACSAVVDNSSSFSLLWCGCLQPKWWPIVVGVAGRNPCTSEAIVWTHCEMPCALGLRKCQVIPYLLIIISNCTSLRQLPPWGLTLRCTGVNPTPPKYKHPCLSGVWVKCGCKNGHQVDIMCSVETGALAQYMSNHSRLNSQHHNWGTYITI